MAPSTAHAPGTPKPSTPTSSPNHGLTQVRLVWESYHYYYSSIIFYTHGKSVRFLKGKSLHISIGFPSSSSAAGAPKNRPPPRRNATSRRAIERPRRPSPPPPPHERREKPQRCPLSRGYYTLHIDNGCGLFPRGTGSVSRRPTDKSTIREIENHERRRRPGRGARLFPLYRA